MEHAEEDARIDAVFRVLDGKIKWENLVPTVLEAAKELEAMPGLKGSERLDILQKVLRHALKKSDMTMTEKEGMLYTIDTIVPVIAQAVVLASKSPILAQVKAVCVGCF
jgi:hypothetical protein